MFPSRPPPLGLAASHLIGHLDRRFDLKEAHRLPRVS